MSGMLFSACHGWVVTIAFCLFNEIGLPNGELSVGHPDVALMGCWWGTGATG